MTLLVLLSLAALLVAQPLLLRRFPALDRYGWPRPPAPAAPATEYPIWVPPDWPDPSVRLTPPSLRETARRPDNPYAPSAAALAQYQMNQQFELANLQAFGSQYQHVLQQAAGLDRYSVTTTAERDTQQARRALRGDYQSAAAALGFQFDPVSAAWVGRGGVIPDADLQALSPADARRRLYTLNYPDA